MIDSTREKFISQLLDQPERSFVFRDWVLSHDPEFDWNFDCPETLANQLCKKGNLNIKEVFQAMFTLDDSGLSLDQNEKFLS